MDGFSDRGSIPLISIERTLELSFFKADSRVFSCLKMGLSGELNHFMCFLWLESRFRGNELRFSLLSVQISLQTPLFLDRGSFRHPPLGKLFPLVQHSLEIGVLLFSVPHRNKSTKNPITCDTM